MSNSIQIEFIGPYLWVENIHFPCIFNSDISNNSGLYLWTVPYNNHELIYYVGETGRNFSIRFSEHFKEHFSGAYHIYEPAKFKQGIKECLWPGRYDKYNRTTINDFIKSAESLYPSILELSKTYRFYVSSFESDKRLRQRIESSIAEYLYQQPGIIGGFQDTGIRYFPRKSDEPIISVTISQSGKLLGLPKALNV